MKYVFRIPIGEFPGRTFLAARGIKFDYVDVDKRDSHCLGHIAGVLNEQFRLTFSGLFYSNSNFILETMDLQNPIPEDIMDEMIFRLWRLCGMFVPIEVEPIDHNKTFVNSTWYSHHEYDTFADRYPELIQHGVKGE